MKTVKTTGLYDFKSNELSAHEGVNMRAIIIAAAVFATTNAGAQSSPSFCERLAPQLGMKQNLSLGKDGEFQWQVNALGGLKNALFGGSSMISFGVTPLGEPSLADYQRLQGTCAQNGKEIVCRVLEPLRLTVQAKGGAAHVDALPGEKATVSTRGTRITCRNSVS